MRPEKVRSVPTLTSLEYELKQPLGLVYEYVIVWYPRPEVEGSKIAVPFPLSVIPFPVKVPIPPPATDPVKMSAGFESQYKVSKPVKLTTGNAETVTG